jgi:hypothetical protein
MHAACALHSAAHTHDNNLSGRWADSCVCQRGWKPMQLALCSSHDNPLPSWPLARPPLVAGWLVVGGWWARQLVTGGGVGVGRRAAYVVGGLLPATVNCQRERKTPIN